MSFELPNLPMLSSPHVPTETRALSPYIGLAALRHRKGDAGTTLQIAGLSAGVIFGIASFTFGGVWRVTGTALILGAVFAYLNRSGGRKRVASVLMKLDRERVARGLDKTITPQAIAVLEPVCEQWQQVENVLAAHGWDGQEQIVNDVRRTMEAAVDNLIATTLAESATPPDISVREWSKELKHALTEVSNILQSLLNTVETYERNSGDPSGAPLSRFDSDVANLYDWLESIR